MFSEVFALEKSVLRLNRYKLFREGFFRCYFEKKKCLEVIDLKVSREGFFTIVLETEMS